MGGARDENDLLSLEAPVLQRALLKVPDALLAQALPAVPQAVAGRLAANLSRRRRRAVRALATRLEASGEATERSGRTALRSLMRRVLEIASLEAEAPEATSRVGPSCRRRAARVGRAAERPEAPDLTPGAYSRLKEARAVLGALAAMSPCMRSLEREKRASAGAALARAWLGRGGRLDRRGGRWYSRQR